MTKKVTLLILDGWGIAPDGPGNAITLANTPYFDKLKQDYPYTEIGAGGEAIGLWKGHQGSSETGHLIIGAGQNVYLPNGIVANAVSSGEVKKNEAYLGAINHVIENNSTLHIAGLMSNKGVHGYDILTHALIELAAEKGVKDLVIHFFSDGRDTRKTVAKKYLDRLQTVMNDNSLGRVGTIMGRYWMMDRDHRWNRVGKGYNAMVLGEAEYFYRSPEEAIGACYKRGEVQKQQGEDFIESDEFMAPSVIVDDHGDPIGLVKDGDSLIWANFRTDRAIEPTQAFVEQDFHGFNRRVYPNIHFVGTFEYYKGMNAPYAFERVLPKNSLGEVFSKLGRKQLRLTETEKWIYLTTIFSGMREEEYIGEDRFLIPSDKIPTYDLKPKMHTLDIAKKAVEVIRKNTHDFMIINFNNPDIVGHTGNLEAAIIGVEECDAGLELIIEAVKKAGDTIVITADHGNAEIMINEDGSVNTYHTANNVPFIMVDEDLKNKQLKNDGALKDVAPTILDIMGIDKPVEMTGESLLNL